MKFKPPSKRKKVDESPSSGPSPSTPAPLQLEKRDLVMKLISKPTVNVQGHETQTSTANVRIQQARDFAVAQARQDGCKGNFRVFDSPYGNYLVPVLPTRKELGQNSMQPRLEDVNEKQICTTPTYEF